MNIIHTIIVNYNGIEWNSACIHSLLAQEEIKQHIIVVDNASTDGSLHALQEEFGNQLVYISLAENRLFAAGCNAGMKYALSQKAQYIFLVNNDTIVEPHCLKELCAGIHNTPKSAGVQALLVHMHAPQKIASAGCRISRTGLAWDAQNNDDIANMPCNPFEVAAITGGASLWQANVLRSIGLFDEAFGMYLEDVDISLRARKAGDALYTVPAARVRHLVSATTNKAPTGFCVRYCHTNALRLILKHWPDEWYKKDCCIWFIISFCALLSNIVRGNWGIAWGLARGFVHGLALLPRGIWHRIFTPMPQNDCLRQWIERRFLFPPR